MYMLENFSRGNTSRGEGFFLYGFDEIWRSLKSHIIIFYLLYNAVLCKREEEVTFRSAYTERYC